MGISFMTHRVKTALLAAAGLMCASVFGHAGLKLSDLEIAHATYTGNVIDIEFAKIALAKSKSPQVRSFAGIMIYDHSLVNEAAAKLLEKLKVEPTDNAFSRSLIADAAAKKAELNALDGLEFDRAYAANELAYHKLVNETVSKVWIPDSENERVRKFLIQALATFRVHEDHAQRMIDALK